MADPVTAIASLAFASNVIQMIQLCADVARHSLRLVNDSVDALQEHTIVEQLTRDYQRLSDASSIACGPKPVLGDVAEVERLAGKCRDEAGDLLKLLDGLKLKDGVRGAKRCFDGVHKATKAVKKREEIRDRQRRLSERNQQLSLAVLQSLSTNQLTYFQDLMRTMEKQSSTSVSAILSSREVIQQTLSRLEKQSGFDECERRKILAEMMDQQQSLSATAVTEIRNVGNLILNDRDKKRSHKIAKTLQFSTMHARLHNMRPAHQNTFGWILGPSSEFRNWLESGSGIFWISGKAGSGKSTLMNFLTEKQGFRTAQALKVWAGAQCRIIVAKAFFYYRGSPMEKSQQGLLQTILYQIFESCPELVETACSQRWLASRESAPYQQTWTFDELLLTLDTVKSLVGTRGYRLCLFIDGLDEYSGDQRDLVDLLQTLAACDHLKLCVSSRPWNVFDSAYGRLQTTLKLEDLTRNDINTYVYGRLSHVLQNASEFHSLAAEIVNKAQGVFLWVFLAVESLREGFDEGDTVKIMRQRVAEFPSELEDYFQVMILERIQKTYRPYAARALFMAFVASGETHHAMPDPPRDLGHGFIDYWLLSNGLEESNFALDLPIKHCTTSDLETMARDTDRALRAYTKDFLCIPKLAGSAQYYDLTSNHTQTLTVEILHRTIFDFLKTEFMLKFMEAHLPLHFTVPAFKTHRALAYYKIVPMNAKCLCADLNKYFFRVLELPESYEKLRIAREFDRVAADHLTSFCNPDCKTHEYSRDDRHPQFYTLIDYFVSHHLHAYVTAMIKQHPLHIQCPEENLILFASALGISIEPFGIDEIDIDLLRFFLQRGADPTQAWDIFLFKSVDGQSMVRSSDIARSRAEITVQNIEKMQKLIELVLEHGPEFNSTFYQLAEIFATQNSAFTDDQRNRVSILGALDASALELVLKTLYETYQTEFPTKWEEASDGDTGCRSRLNSHHSQHPRKSARLSGASWGCTILARR